MTRKSFVFSLMAAAFMASSCSQKLDELAAQYVTVNPNPLEADAGKVPATINITFPEKYMAKKAVVTLTPELRYGNGQKAVGTPATFQGEKVVGNDQTIAYVIGGHATMKSTFDFAPGMEKSELYLVVDAKLGNKPVDLPAVKVADGVISTSQYFTRTIGSAAPSLATDAYQRVTKEKQEANIKFLIQQADLRKSELKNNSVAEFVNLLKRINEDREGLALSNIEVSAYASPDGGFSLNDKLAAQRQQNTEKYVAQQLKSQKMEANVDAKYTAQDWEGFKDLVAASNIQDKDVIVRVLEMYKDPEEREAQIKNMSAAFKELADGILPQLRRARMTINYEVIGRSDSEISSLLNSDASQLGLEEILYAAANLQNSDDAKVAAYKKAIELFPNDGRAYNNVAAIEFARGNYDAAKSYLDKAKQHGGANPEVAANLGLIALNSGNLSQAETLLGSSASASGAKEAMGNLLLAKGDYAGAQKTFGETKSNSAALAQILNKDYAAAAKTLSAIVAPDADTYYLQAILNARQGSKPAAAAALKRAIQLDPSLAEKAANDLELVNIDK